MRIFILKIIGFLVASFGLVLSLVFFAHYTVANKFNFEIDNSKKTLFLGHSHPECAYDDSIIENSKNLSKGGESYFYTYYKLKNVLKSNPHIDRVFLEYSNTMLTKKMDKWTFGYQKMNAHLPWHASFLSQEDFNLIYQNSANDAFAVLSTSTRVNLLKLIFNKLSIDKDFGSYVSFDRSFMPSIDISNIDGDNLDNRSTQVSQQSIRDLDRIVRLCNIHKVELLFIRSPQHTTFNRQNEDSLMWYKANKYPQVKFIDLDAFPLQDKQFGDEGHINKWGAEDVSIWLNTLMKNNVLQRNDYKEVTEKEIDAIGQ